MSNMSYCRFENTSGDLRDCLVAVQEMTREELDALSKSEKIGLAHIVDLARQIVELADDGDLQPVVPADRG